MNLLLLLVSVVAVMLPAGGGPEIAELDKQAATEHLQRGSALAKQGKFEEAIVVYREAIRLNPDFSKAYHNLGMALDKQDKLDEAIAAYREAIRLDPTIASPHNYLAKALGKQGKRAEARKHYKIARGINNRNEIIELRERIKHDSSAPYLYHRLGILLTDEGNFEEAVTSHRTAVKLEPNNQNYRQLLGAALLRLGRQAEADKELKIALELIEAARRK